MKKLDQFIEKLVLANLPIFGYGKKEDNLGPVVNSGPIAFPFGRFLACGFVATSPGGQMGNQIGNGDGVQTDIVQHSGQ